MSFGSFSLPIDVLVLNFKAMLSTKVKVGKKDFCIAFAGKQQKCCDRAPFKLLPMIRTSYFWSSLALDVQAVSHSR